MDRYRAILRVSLLKDNTTAEAQNVVAGYAAAGMAAGRMKPQTFCKVVACADLGTPNAPIVAALLDKVKAGGDPDKTKYTEEFLDCVHSFRVFRGLDAHRDGTKRENARAAALTQSCILGFLLAGLALDLLTMGQMAQIYDVATCADSKLEDAEKLLKEALEMQPKEGPNEQPD